MVYLLLMALQSTAHGLLLLPPTTPKRIISATSCRGGAADASVVIASSAEATPTDNIVVKDKEQCPRRRLVSSAQCFLKQYQIVALTALTLASGAVLTQQLPLDAMRMRRDILAGAIIFSVGDVGAQILTNRRGQQQQQQQQHKWTLDQQRFAISTTLGAFWAGVCNPAVYRSVERLFPGTVSIAHVLAKMLITCSILSTAGNYFTMFFRRWALHLCSFVQNKSERNFATVVSRLKICIATCNQDIVEVISDDLKIWPLYDVMCFSIIPPAIRPISTAIMASLWSMYMSIASAKTSQEERNGNSEQGDGAVTDTVVEEQTQEDDNQVPEPQPNSV